MMSVTTIAIIVCACLGVVASGVALGIVFWKRHQRRSTAVQHRECEVDGSRTVANDESNRELIVTINSTERRTGQNKSRHADVEGRSYSRSFVTSMRDLVEDDVTLLDAMHQRRSDDVMANDGSISSQSLASCAEAQDYDEQHEEQTHINHASCGGDGDEYHRLRSPSTGSRSVGSRRPTLLGYEAAAICGEISSAAIKNENNNNSTTAATADEEHPRSSTTRTSTIMNSMPSTHREGNILLKNGGGGGGARGGNDPPTRKVSFALPSSTPAFNLDGGDPPSSSSFSESSQEVLNEQQLNLKPVAHRKRGSSALSVAEAEEL